MFGLRCSGARLGLPFAGCTALAGPRTRQRRAGPRPSKREVREGGGIKRISSGKANSPKLVASRLSEINPGQPDPPWGTRGTLVLGRGAGQTGEVPPDGRNVALSRETRSLVRSFPGLVFPRSARRAGLGRCTIQCLIRNLTPPTHGRISRRVARFGAAEWASEGDEFLGHAGKTI